MVMDAILLIQVKEFWWAFHENSILQMFMETLHSPGTLTTFTYNSNHPIKRGGGDGSVMQTKLKCRNPASSVQQGRGSGLLSFLYRFLLVDRYILNADVDQ